MHDIAIAINSSFDITSYHYLVFINITVNRLLAR